MNRSRLGEELLQHFDHLYVVNLPQRTDRRKQMEQEFQTVGLTLPHPKISFFNAIRPDVANGFPSIGAHGCYLSHLAIIKDAKSKGYNSVLVAEDDLEFAFDGFDAIGFLQLLRESRWHFFYGGYHFPRRFVSEGIGLINVGQRYKIGGTHLYGLSEDIYDSIIAYLESLLGTTSPKPHLDIAFNAFRAEYPDCVTYVTSPAFGIQRRSRSDVQDLGFYDRLPLFRPLVDFFRMVAGKRKC